MIEYVDMYDVLNNACDDLDFNEIAETEYDELEKKLIKLGLFKDSKSIKLFLVTEGLNCIYNQEYSHPITFLEKETEIPEDEIYLHERGLTDNYINEF